MMTLNYLSCDIQAFDTVGINSSLCQPFGIGNLSGLFVENLDEVPTDNLTLLLWFCHALQVRKELFACIYAYHIQTQTFVIMHHICELILTKHTMIHKDTGQLATDCSVQQYSTDATVNSARQPQYYAVSSYLLTQLTYCCLYIVGCRPVLSATTNIHDKVLQQKRSLNTMENFGMELNPIDRLTTIK